ncbi:MAG TPA: glycosyltransferase [Vicinamibacterales bacterium]|nr:glycosyltransferase [Vicinamibacterales bacterium]
MTTARVLNVVPTLMCGGTENQFMALARTLDRTRFDVEFACLRRWGGFVEELEQRNIPLTEYPVPTFRSVTALAQQARLARHIVRRGVQIVHAYNFYGNVFATPPARLVAPVTIASIRDRAPYLTAMQKRVQRYACQFADCILVNADAVKDWLIGEGYDASKISVIRNGVDLSRFDNAPPRAELRRELGLPDGTPLVGVISRLTRLKGLEHFLEAAAMVRARVPNARFLIAGETSPMDREYLGELQQYAERCGVAESVIFTGLRRDVPAVLSSLDVSVMPSLNEALSNVVLESMAAGAPTVATRVGGTPEAIVDGVTGVLVPPADSRALADAIVHLLHDTRLATHLGAAARARIVDHFSVRRMVRSTEDLYVELLERKQRKRLPSAAC